MKAWLLNLWDKLLNSFWFIPSLFLIASLVLSILCIKLDDYVQTQERYSWSWLTTTATSSRAMLSTMAGAMVTVTGVVFSITMLTLAQTSSQYGSRLLRSVLQSNVTQFTLGVFLSTTVFCFVVLRNVREFGDADSREAFVPHISTLASLVLGLISLIVFIYFVHQVSRAIEAQTIVRVVSNELLSAIDRLFPQKIGEEPEEDDPTDIRFLNMPLRVIRSDKLGYLQSINGESLLEYATEHDLVLHVGYMPGQFVYKDSILCAIHTGNHENLPTNFDQIINDCFILGNRRTPRQDIECPINELVEVAVRALSPGINDPFTALSCVDHLCNALIQLVQRKQAPDVRADESGAVRLYLDSSDIHAMINTSFNQIRQYAGGAPAILIRIVEGLTEIAKFTTDSKTLSTLERHCNMLSRTCEATVPEAEDCQDFQKRVDQFHRVLEEGTAKA